MEGAYYALFWKLRIHAIRQTSLLMEWTFLGRRTDNNDIIRSKLYSDVENKKHVNKVPVWMAILGQVTGVWYRRPYGVQGGGKLRLK